MKLLIAHDYPADAFVGWYELTNLVQKHLGLSMQLLTPTTRQAQNAEVSSADYVFASPFDIDGLMQAGFVPFARPISGYNEMVIVAPKTSYIKKLSDIKAGVRIATTDSQAVKAIGLRLLEAVDVFEDDVQFRIHHNYQGVSQDLITGQTDAAFFFERVYKRFSAAKKQAFEVLIKSDLQELHHVFLARSGINTAPMLQMLGQMHLDQDGKKTLEALDLIAFEATDENQTLFMLDVLETLRD